MSESAVDLAVGDHRKASVQPAAATWRLPAQARAALREDGFFIGSEFIAPEALAAVQSEIADWAQVPAINGYGCLFHQGDALIQNLGLYSAATLRLALDETILDFMEAHFGERVVLSKCEYRRAVQRKEVMPLHSDGTPDVSIYVYLSGVENARGATAVMPGSQRIGVRENGDYMQIPAEVQRKYDFPIVEVQGPPGVCLFFDLNCWHLRTRTERIGREILWFTYTPLSRADSCVELAFARHALMGLSPRQIEALGLGLPAFKGRVGEDFRLSREISHASLTFLPDSMLIRTLIARNVQRAKAAVPPAAKLWLKRVLRLQRPETLSPRSRGGPS